MNIFISYNHRDQQTALRIKDNLISNGVNVTIDIEKMKPGQGIEPFIIESIRSTDATLFLISRNSLLSSWVAMEFIISNIDELLRSRKIIPCYIDNDFFHHSFTLTAIEKIDQQILEIDNLMQSAISKGYGIEDVQNERTRLNQHKSYLPRIIQKFRETLCINLTPDDFHQGMEKILSELKTTSKQAITNDILEGIRKQQTDTKLKQITLLQNLLEDYEKRYFLEKDPREIKRYEDEIERTKRDLQKAAQDLQLLTI